MTVVNPIWASVHTVDPTTGKTTFSDDVEIDGVLTQAATGIITTPLWQLNDSNGNAIVTMRTSLPATPTAAQNTFYIAGQQPSTMTAGIDSYIAHIRGWGQGSSTAAGQMALRVHFPASADAPFLTNYTGSKLAAAINAQTDSTSTGVSPIAGFVGNAALIGYANGATAGWNYGTFGRAASSTAANFGAIGQATTAVSGVWNVGVLGVGRNTNGGGWSNSGYFWVGATDPTNPQVSSCVLLDTGTTAVPMLVGWNASATRFQMDSKGNIAMTPAVTAAGATAFSLTPAQATAVSAEVNDFSIPAHTMVLAGGYNLQRFVYYAQPTVSAATPQTVVTGATLAIDGPPLVAGAGPAAITNKVSLWVSSAIATVAGGSLGTAIGIGLASNAPALGIRWGSGAPTIAAPKGSLYLRTDGTTTNDRAYINTDAGTTWTALITAA